MLLHSANLCSMCIDERFNQVPLYTYMHKEVHNDDEDEAMMMFKYKIIIIINKQPIINELEYAK